MSTQVMWAHAVARAQRTWLGIHVRDYDAVHWPGISPRRRQERGDCRQKKRHHVYEIHHQMLQHSICSMSTIPVPNSILYSFRCFLLHGAAVHAESKAMSSQSTQGRTSSMRRVEPGAVAVTSSSAQFQHAPVADIRGGWPKLPQPSIAGPLIREREIYHHRPDPCICFARELLPPVVSQTPIDDKPGFCPCN